MDRPKGKVLVIDDDIDLADTLKMGLKGRGYQVHTLNSGNEVVTKLESDDFDVVLTDLQMEGLDGLGVARYVVENRDIPVMIMTGQGDMDKAIEAIRAGVYDFLPKPVALDVVTIALDRAIQHKRLGTELRRLSEQLSSTQTALDMIGESGPIEQLRDLVKRVAGAEVSVLVTGESGTGKELVARALHKESGKKGRFVAVNCAALPETLLESELFGHKKGAFTDARTEKKGLFLEANDGTLFLDEIGDMPIGMQVKLLRALQESKIRPVGGTEEVHFSSQVIAATHRDLEEAIEVGDFREDLYYRINVVRIPVPPLRTRGNDILILAQHFIERAREKSNRLVKEISEPAAHRLLAYDWPGNVRELENCMERAVALARFDRITAEDLPEKIQNYDVSRAPNAILAPELLSMEALERRHIQSVLKATDGNKTRAAEILGFDRRTLYRKMERFGMEL